MLNSFVHVVMYGYYFSTSIGYPLIFLKPYITKLQMTQFVMVATNSLSLILFLKLTWVERFLEWLLLFYMMSLLVLFMNYFKKEAKRRLKMKQKKEHWMSTLHFCFWICSFISILLEVDVKLAKKKERKKKWKKENGTVLKASPSWWIQFFFVVSKMVNRCWKKK